MKRTLTSVSFLLLSLLLLFVVAVARADMVYVIQPGDSLSRIATRFGVTVDAIVEANNIVNPRVIVAGRELIIPGVADPNATPTATPTATGSRPITTGTAVEGGFLHVVQPRESLSRIAQHYKVPMDDIIAANNLASASLIVAGRELFIPTGAGGTAGATRPAPTPRPAATTTATTPTNATNLFKNGSFEDDWHYYLYNELQIPDGWQVAIDEGPNTLQPGAGGNFARPEIRLVSRGQLAESEWDSFIFNGNKTLKAFKGYAPTIFHFFQDVYLQPGRYRMTTNFFPDIVAQYFPGGDRDFVTDPLSGEVRVIHNEEATEWTTVTAGQKNNRVYEFTVTRPGAVRLGTSFRNRFGPANNGWFLDDWKLERIGN